MESRSWILLSPEDWPHQDPNISPKWLQSSVSWTPQFSLNPNLDLPKPNLWPRLKPRPQLNPLVFILLFYTRFLSFFS